MEYNGLEVFDDKVEMTKFLVTHPNLLWVPSTWKYGVPAISGAVTTSNDHSTYIFARYVKDGSSYVGKFMPIYGCFFIVEGKMVNLTSGFDLLMCS